MSAVRDFTASEVALAVGANTVSSLIGFSAGPPFFIEGGTGGQGAIWWDNNADDPYRGYWISNNGVLSLKGPFTSKTPIPLSTVVSTALPILCPFWADIDTTLGGSVAYFQNVDVAPTDGFGNVVDDIELSNGYGATWHGVRTPGGGSAANTFQVVIIERREVGPGGIIGPTNQPYFDFDIEFNYDSIQWDKAGAFRVGFYSGINAFEFPLSAVGGRYLDSDRTNGLIWNSHDSAVLGRYVFRVRWSPITGAIIFTADDGLLDNEQINDFYNGGTGGSGSTGGSNVGVSFSNFAARRGASLNFGGGDMRSADGANLILLTSAAGTINIPAGFTTEFSASIFVATAPVVIQFFDAINGGGTLLKSVQLPVTGSNYQGWRTLLVGLDSLTVRSIRVTGTANRFAMDTMRLGTYFTSSQLLSPTTGNLVFPNSCEDRP